MNVPNKPINFIRLIKMINKNIQKSNKICVHCDAGIGRTGTLICINIIYGQLLKFIEDFNKNKKNEKFKISIYETVKILKEQRTGMVLTPQQYIFCYKAILEIFEKIYKEFINK